MPFLPSNGLVLTCAARRPPSIARGKPYAASQRDATMRPTPYQAYIRIQIGCDKFCTYCIVPSVRGPEQSRPPSDIVREVNGETIDSADELKQVAERQTRWWKFTVERDGRLLRQVLRY